MFFRKQNYLYILAALLGLILPVVPFLAIDQITSTAKFAAVSDKWPLAGSTSMTVLSPGGFLLIAVAIGLFVALIVTINAHSKLKKQLSFGKKALIISLIGTIGVVAMTVFPLTYLQLSMNGEVLSNGWTTLPLPWIFYLYVAGNLFILLANRFVKSDIRLIDDANRIR